MARACDAGDRDCSAVAGSRGRHPRRRGRASCGRRCTRRAGRVRRRWRTADGLPAGCGGSGVARHHRNRRGGDAWRRLPGAGAGRRRPRHPARRAPPAVFFECATDAEIVSFCAGITSVATSLGAPAASAAVFEACRSRRVPGGGAAVRSHVASDAEAVGACLRFCDDHRLLVEPACGAALAAVYAAAPALRAAQSVVVVVCGGAVVDAASLRATARKLGVALPD